MMFDDVDIIHQIEAYILTDLMPTKNLFFENYTGVLT